MTVVELATCCLPEDPASPAPTRGDTPWRAWRSTSEDSVCHHTDSSLSIDVLWPGAASLDPLGDLAYGGFYDPV
jgi:hypothetical protein